MRGFRHFMFEDNYAPLDARSDILSIKQVCEPSWERQFPEIRDGFGRIKMQNDPEHAALWSRVLTAMLDEYYEFPPVATPALVSDAKPMYDLEQTTPPLLDNDDAGRAAFKELGLHEPRFLDYLGHYGHICYLSVATRLR